MKLHNYGSSRPQPAVTHISPQLNSLCLSFLRRKLRWHNPLSVTSRMERRNYSDIHNRYLRNLVSQVLFGFAAIFGSGIIISHVSREIRSDKSRRCNRHRSTFCSLRVNWSAEMREKLVWESTDMHDPLIN